MVLCQTVLIGSKCLGHSVYHDAKWRYLGFLLYGSLGAARARLNLNDIAFGVRVPR